jgi:hypothetical protein
MAGRNGLQRLVRGRVKLTSILENEIAQSAYRRGLIGVTRCDFDTKFDVVASTSWPREPLGDSSPDRMVWRLTPRA